MYAILGSRGREAKDNTQNLEAGFITKNPSIGLIFPVDSKLLPSL